MIYYLFFDTLLHIETIKIYQNPIKFLLVVKIRLK